MSQEKSTDQPKDEMDQENQLNEPAEPLQAELDPAQSASDSTDPAAGQFTEPADAPQQTEDQQTEDRPQTATPPTTKPTTKPTPSGGGRLLAGLALLLALIALSLSGWLGWQQWQQQQHPPAPAWQGPVEQLNQQVHFLKQRENEQKQRIEDLQQALQQANNQQQQALESLKQQQAGLKQRIDALALADERMQNALVQLAQLKTGGDRAQKLMEIEFLLRTAILRVELFRNRDLALRALEMANRHLASLDNPAYSRVRVQVEAEIKALKAVAMPDYAHWLGVLSQMRQQQQQWPLKQAETNTTTEQAKEEGYLAKAGKLLSELVQVRKVDQAPPLPKNWQQASHQALLLQLSALESALASGQPDLVKPLAASTRQWIESQFDTRDAGVQQALAELNLLQAAPLQAELPPVGQSLQVFRQVVARLSGAPAPASTESGDGEQP